MYGEIYGVTCGNCKTEMHCNAERDGVVWCPNPHCSVHEVRYAAPIVTLVPKDLADWKVSSLIVAGSHPCTTKAKE